LSTAQPIRIRFVFPLLAQPQAVSGNLLVLADRGRRRGIAVDTAEWHTAGPLPAAELYVVGGAEDSSMAVLTERLRDGGLVDAVRGGAAVLAVDAGYQVLGTTFELTSGEAQDGLGLLDVVSTRVAERAEGPIIAHGDPALGLGVLSGYETHRGRTTLGSGATPLATLELGIGNGDTPATDGAVGGHVVGTYLHGPTLARNVELADLLLRWATGRDELEPLDDTIVHELRDQHLAEERVDPTGWGGRVYGKKSILQRLPGPRA
jgi:CobQ-like glutamine amidotransferase family enzyme